MKILVVGDSFMPAGVFERGFAGLAAEHEIRYVELDEGRVLEPASASEHAIREYMGHPAQLAELLAADNALIVHSAPVTDAVLESSPRLGLVGCARGGPVNVDVAAATERGVAVVSSPGKNAEAVADLTIAFLVMLARGVPRSQRFLLEGGRMGESAFEGAQFFGHDLGGHVLGLVGYGQVGRRVARRARSFGMEVVVHDPYVQALDGGVRLVERLDELLEAAEFVSAHARITRENVNLFDERAFSRMRKGAWFVNTAREELVDEDALAGALARGHLAGAALDVVRPREGRNPLLNFDRVIVTPHIGGATHETLARGAAMLADELRRVAAGRRAVNVVNPQVVAGR